MCGCDNTPPSRLNWAQASLLALALVGPRAARMAAPRIWLEDTPYAYAGFLIMRGQRPYVDFVCPHFPVLEGGLAAAYRVFGARARTAETLTQLATLLAAWLVFGLTRRAWSERAGGGDGFWPGLTAALLYGACALTFRYHLFEREAYLNVLALAAAWLALYGRPGRRRGVAIGALLCLGALVKLTFVVYAAALAAYMWRWERDRAGARLALAAAAGLGAAATLLCYALYGGDFLFQVFGFHWFKGKNFLRLLDKWDAARYWCSAPAAAGAMALALADRIRRRPARWAWTTLAAYLAYFLFLSPTLWAHNLLMLLPSLCLLGGLACAEAVVGLRRSPARSAAAAAACAAMLLWVTPLHNRNWRPEGAWGFAGLRRADLEEAARVIRTRTRPDDRILAPPIVALEANRIDPFHYRELLGVCRWARESVRRSGWFCTRAIGALAPLHSIELDTRRYWMPQVFEQIRRRRFAAVVPDNDFTHFGVLFHGDLGPALAQAGYRVACSAGPLEVWTPRR